MRASARTYRRLTAAVAAAALALLALPALASATTYPTTYVAGTGGVDISAASDGNQCDVESAPCATLAGALAQTASGGTVELSGTLSETGQTGVDQDVTIAANPDSTSSPAAELTGSSGASDNSLLAIGDDGNPYTVTVGGITFTSVSDGSAISNNDGGTLTVDHSSFTGNSLNSIGAALDNADGFGGTGTLTVVDSNFTDNTGSYDGAAISNALDGGSGSVTVTGSTFTGNQARDYGAAINDAEGNLTVSDSTFTDNAIISGGEGGGAIEVGDEDFPGTATVSGSTFDGNSGGFGGAIDLSSTDSSSYVTVSDSTLFDNTAGYGGALNIEEQGAIAVTDSTLSGNTATNTGNEIDADEGTGSVSVAADVIDGTCAAGSGSWSDGGYNAATDDSCLTGSSSTAPTATGDVVNADAGDLGALIDNGGPTETIGLEPGNAAVDRIPHGVSFPVTAAGATLTVACPTTDQRGVASPAGAGCDAGAVEYVLAATTYVAGSGGVDVANAGDGNDCSSEATPCATLAGALAQTATGGTVELSGTLTESAAIDVDQDATIAANPDSTSTPAAEIAGAVSPAPNPDATGLLTIGDDTVSIQGITFQDGDNTGTYGGGAIDNDGGGTLNVNDSTFTGNTGPDGGAIDNSDDGGVGFTSTATITSSTLSGNTSGDGGAIDNNDGTSKNASLTVTDSTLTGNQASFDGGAIDNNDDGLSQYGSVTVTSSTLTGNSAGFDGGAIDSSDYGSIDASVTITDSTLSGNTASGDGGTLDNNDHFGGGGHVYVTADVLTGTCNGNGWTDDGYNAATDVSCLGGTAASSDATVGSDAGDLGALADNGGPTETAELLAGNPAIDLIPSAISFTVPAGSGTVTVACPVAADQRGIASVSGGACDAGAVQYAGQSLSFGGTLPASAVVGQSGSMLAPSSSSGLAVALSLDAATTNHACSLSGEALSFAHAGSCVLDLNQAGNVNFSAAAQLQQAITVNPAQTATSVTVGSSAVTATVTAVAPGGGTPTGTVVFTVAGQTIGSATLMNGTATLAYAVPANTTQQITAGYQGSDDYDASSAAASGSGPTVTTTTTTPTTTTTTTTTVSPPPRVVHNPTLTATLRGTAPKSSSGWWHTPVRVTFHCVTHGSALKHGCPRAVVLDRSGRDLKLTRTITARNGGHAKLTLTAVNIDLSNPHVEITGPSAGHSYLISSPAAHCHATGTVSGIASCTLTHHLTHAAGAEAIIYTARATSHAGRSSTARLTVHLRTLGLAGVTPGSDGAYAVTPGHSYTLEVLSGTKPAYVDAAVTPQPPLGTHEYFTFAGRLDGTNLWKLALYIEPGVGLYRHWTIGVLIGHSLHTLALMP